MRKTKLFGALAAGVAISVFGFAGTAHADPADDAAILIENLPAAVEELVAGMQEAADTLAETQSVEDTTADLRNAIIASGQTLVAGTEQFGALGLGFQFMVNPSLEAALAPFVQAADDPANAGDLVNPDDIAALQENLPVALDYLQANLATALSEGLQGNLVAPGFLDPASGTPSLFGNSVAIVGNLFSAATLYILVGGTTLEGVGQFTAVIGVLGGAAVGGVVGEDLVDLEESLAPVFESLAPATAPIVEALQGL